MTPKEQAEELVNKYWNDIPDLFFEEAKECALIAVEKVILNCYEEEEYYWQEVKQEIEKL
jgi:hypothetical protein